MKKFANFAVTALIASTVFYVATLIVSTVFYASQISENSNNFTGYDADQLAWCDRIYHRNIICPKFGQVGIPPAVLAREKAKYLAWCESIHHKNEGCPKYGWVEM